MPTDVLLVICNHPHPEQALAIAEILVQEGLAACVSVGTKVTSVYEWDGRMEQTEEWPLLIKTCGSRYPELEQRLKELHPYEVPEIIGIPTAAGSAAYLEWVIACTTPGA